MNAGALIELHAAAQHFLRGRRHADEAARVRLRQAVVAVLRARGAEIPASYVESSEEALAALDALLRRCQALGVNWADIVALVNREWKEEQRAYG